MKTSVWKAPLCYQLRGTIFGAAVMLLIVTLIPIAIAVLVSVLQSEGEVRYFGYEFSVFIFCFVMGCTCWRDAFHLGLAGGVPRKVLYGAALLSMTIVCALLAPVTLLGVALASLVPTNHIVLLSAVFPGNEGLLTAPFSDVGALLQSMPFQFSVSLFLAFLGCFIGCVFYVISKKARIAMAILIPALAIFVPAGASVLLPEYVIHQVFHVLGYFFGSMWRTTGLCFVLALVFAVLGWIPVHNSALMRNPQPSGS